jgi:uncharacterized membrane protein
MTIASIILGFLIASIPACLFNFFVAGKFSKLLILNVFAWIGFWAGQIISNWRGWTILQVGPIVLGVDLLAAIVFIAIGFWLTNFQTESPKKSR